MMRLAIIAPHFPEYVLRYAAAMAKHCDVLVFLDADRLAAEYAGREIPETGVGRLERVRFKSPRDLLRMVRAISRFRPSVVHFQEASGPKRAFFSVCVAAMTRASATIVLTVHDPVPHEGRDRLAAQKMAWARTRLRRQADIIVVHGAYCGRLMRERIGFATQQVVESEHGLILEPPALLPLPAAPLKLYFFGRMEAYKGVEVLLSMAESLHDEGLPFELTIAGHGPELDRLQARFERLPEVSVYNGFVPPLQVMASIQAADCVLLPYLSATQSGVLAAAFAGRRYVIASETGGITDVVEHGRNGLVVSPGDPQALADAVRRVAHDKALRVRLHEGADATAREKLDWSRIAEELFEVFERAAVNRRIGAKFREYDSVASD